MSGIVAKSVGSAVRTDRVQSPLVAGIIHHFDPEFAMPATIDVFVTYSHQDRRYLQKGSLLGFLRGLETEGVRFWTDTEIPMGADWDQEIKARLRASPIALVLVSQGFLDSAYCRQVEIEQLLAQKAHLLPVILSACEWQRHDWLSSRQFLPTGGQTIEEHYKDPGKRKRLFLVIREQLRAQVERLHAEPLPGAAEVVAEHDAGMDPRPDAPLSPGRVKLELQRRLGDDWRALADVLGIKPHVTRAFEQGFEGRAIWEWLQVRERLGELPAALSRAGRGDLAALFADPDGRSPQ